MNFQDLHELLRLHILQRIEQGDLTGTRLAQQTGFQQAHISNFLNRKRALSLEGLDRVLAAQQLTVDQILPIDLAASVRTSDRVTASAIASSGAESPRASDWIETVPLVSASAAAEEAQIHAGSVIESIEISASRLSTNRARPSRRQAEWQRFVAIRSAAQEAAAMEPLLRPDSVAVIDRHYNSIAPYRAHEPALLAVRRGHGSGPGLLLRYVEFDDGRLILRRSSNDCPVQLVAVGPGETPSDFIVGRVCLLFYEL